MSRDVFSDEGRMYVCVCVYAQTLFSLSASEMLHDTLINSTAMAGPPRPLTLYFFVTSMETSKHTHIRIHANGMTMSTPLLTTEKCDLLGTGEIIHIKFLFDTNITMYLQDGLVKVQHSKKDHPKIIQLVMFIYFNLKLISVQAFINSHVY